MKWKTTALILLTLLLIPACTFNQAPSPDHDQQKLPPNKVVQKPKEGGTITVGIETKYLKTDPLGFTLPQAAVFQMDALLYRGLFKYDEHLQLKPDLAASFELNQEENKISFILKDQLKWQDGTPITLEDVQFTIEWYSQKDYNGKWKPYTFHMLGSEDYRRGKSEHISGIVILPEEKKMIIQVKELNINDLQLLTAPILPKHQLMGKGMDEVKNLTLHGGLLSSGPFKLQSNHDLEWVFVKNDAFEEKVYLDRITFTNVDQQKNFDLIIGLPQHVAKNIRKNKLETLIGNGYYYLGMNFNNPIWENTSLRKAIALSIDYDQIKQEVFQGYAEIPLTPIHPKSWAYQAVRIDRSDEQEIKNRLAEKKLSLNLVYTDTPLQQLLAEKVSMQLQSAGIIVKLQPLPSEQYTSRLFSKGDFDLFLAEWPFELDPIGENAKWLTKNDALEGGYNVSHLHDQTSDRMLVNGSNRLNMNERKEIYGQWQEYFMAQHYIIPLASPNLILLEEPTMHIDLKNSLVPYVNIINWWTEK